MWLSITRFPRAGKALLSFVLVSSLAVLAFLSANIYATRDKNILAYVNSLDTNGLKLIWLNDISFLILRTLADMWEDVYIKPYCRASPYICGIFLGYIFFKVKKVRLSYVRLLNDNSFYFPLHLNMTLPLRKN